MFRNCARLVGTIRRCSTLHKDFDREIFRKFEKTRDDRFNVELRKELEKIFSSSSPIETLRDLNSNPSKCRTLKIDLSVEEFKKILYFSYKNNLRLDGLTKFLIDQISMFDEKSVRLTDFVELLHLLVVHRENLYDKKTKNVNKKLDKVLTKLEENLPVEEIDRISVEQLGLISSSMYRLQVPMKNRFLLEKIRIFLSDDRTKKNLSALDKQNFVKIVSASNYKTMEIGRALVERFIDSFDERQENRLSPEIVRLAMRIAVYLFEIRFYSPQFFETVFRIVDKTENSEFYRGKDLLTLIQISIQIGFVQQIRPSIVELIENYDRNRQFDGQIERLVDLLQPLAMIEYFPTDLIRRVFVQQNLQRFKGFHQK